MVVTLAAVTGFLAIATEALWVRALVLSFNGTVYVFALILTAYLLGIGGGSLLLARLRRFVKCEVLLLGLLYLIVALGCLLAMVLFPRFASMSAAMRGSGLISGWASNISAMGLMAMLAMLPSTLAMGASLPLLIGLADIPKHEGREAGRLYGVNTFGGIAGSLLGAFVLLPWLGLSLALLALAGGYLLLFAVLGMSGRMRIKRSYVTVVPLLAVIGLGTAGFYPEVNGLKGRPGARILYYHDAPSGTVGVYDDRQGIRTLRVNNYYGLSDTQPETVRLQWRLGHLPILLHPSPERALLIGFATGTTLAAMSEHGLSALDCVELHPAVIEMARYFDVVNKNVVKKPGVTVEAGDGRRYLKRAGPGYDVIVGDLYLPINAGVGSLFSIEHFRAVYNRLNDGGVFVAWIPLYQMGPDQVASAMRTFLEVFPDAEGWMGNWGKARPIIGLVGWKGGAPDIDARDLETKLWDRNAEEPGLRQQQQVQSRQLLSTAALQRWAEGAPRNTLDNPVIEYGAPRALLEVWVRGRTVADENHRAIQEALRGTVPGTR
jgi:spermidine synthase